MNVITATPVVLPTLSVVSRSTALDYKSPLLSLPDDYNTADLMVAYLNQIGVEYIFGVPGGSIEPLYDAMARSERQGGLRHVLARHEAGAAFMADGYARETGKIGVCCSTSGPGATNLITGVANAYENHVPMLVLTGQPALPTFGRHPLQDSSCTGVNILAMMKHCTVYNSLVSHEAQVETKLVAALQSCVRGATGPAHLTFPADVLRAKHAASHYDLKRLLRESHSIDDNEVDALCDALLGSSRPVFLIGSRAGAAAATLVAVASKFNIPFVTTPDGKGFVSPSHRLYRGVVGFGGHSSALELLGEENCDLIVAFGASMGEWNSSGWNSNLLNRRLVHVDDCESHLARSPMASMHIRGSLSAIASRVQQTCAKFPKTFKHKVTHVVNYVDELSSTLQPSDPIKPQRLMRDLSSLFPAGTVYHADTGNSVAWATHYLNPSFPAEHDLSKGWLRSTMNWAAMGWAIGAAVGTAIANRDIHVVCITGDGSMLMNGQELSVAVAENLKIVFVVLNDSSLGMVKHGQRLAGAEQTGCMMPHTDFAAIARALGATGITVDSSFVLEDFDYNEVQGPVLLDVIIDTEQVPPMKSRIKTLNAATV